MIGSGCTQRVVRTLVMNAMFALLWDGVVWLYPWLHPILFHGVKLGVAVSKCPTNTAREKCL